MNRSVRLFLSTTCLTALLTGGVVMQAHANPDGGVVNAGQATITANGKTLDIHQQTDKAVIDWRGFNIGADETTNFHQPGTDSITLNRVHSNSASQINGRMSATGNVVIVNQNGVVFGAGSQVDVHGLVASTADIDNDRFMNDTKISFDKAGKADARIINNGSITARDAGLVGFVAPYVENNGVISARMGRVQLASGSTATVDLYGDGLMEVEVDDTVQSQLVSNTGSISADGGTIALTAAAGGQIVHNLINASGTLRAQSIGVKNGEIIISAAGSNKTRKQGHSSVIVSASMDVSGKKPDEKGGKFTVTGDDITLEDTAHLNASGYAGGGTIKLGGDYQGTGTTPTALTLTVKKDSIIENDALTTGNGGRTILWSDAVTSFDGKIFARGGAVSGNGGFAEVSGKEGLSYNGFADLTALNGDLGTLLLDPTDITISSAASSAISFNAGTGTYSGSAASSNLNVGVLQTQLGSGNVIVTTASAQAGGGDITILDPITWSAARNLTLTADRDIFINAAVTANGAATINATGRDIFFNASVSTSGAGGINATASRNLTVAAASTVSSGATGLLSLRAAGGNIANTGLLTLNGKIRGGASAFTLLSGTNGANRADLLLNSATFGTVGTAVGNVSVTGFNDITLDTVFTSGGSTTLAAQRDLTINSALIGNSVVNSSHTLTAVRDIFINANVTASGGGGISSSATRHQTIAAGATVTSGATGLMSLRAANGVTTNTGLLTINGNIYAGSSSFSLISGLDGTTRSNLTLTSSNYGQGANVNATSFTGFNDITINTAINANGTINLSASRDITLNNPITLSGGATALQATALRDIYFNGNVTASGTGGITALATNNLTVASGATISAGATGALSLRAAAGNIANAGLLTIDGKIRAGSNTLTLLSGLNGTARNDLTIDNNTYAQVGSAPAGVTITGFRDVNINKDFSSGSSNMSITAQRDVNVASGVRLGTNAGYTVTLRAAGGSIGNIGLVNFNGIMDLTNNSGLIFLSGTDASGNRNDLTINSSNLVQQGSVINSFQLTGFRDITLNRDIISNQPVTVVAQRNLTIDPGVTVQTGTTTTLQAAGGVITNTGLFNMNGKIIAGSGALTLTSGLDGTTRSNLTLDSNTYQQGATVGTINITGFNDMLVDTPITVGSNSMNLTAERNFTIGSNATFKTNSGFSTNLKAAGGNINNIGLLDFGGVTNLTLNSGLILLSGRTSSGDRIDLTLDNSNYLMGGATTNTLNITGFRDVTINRDLTLQTQPITIIAQRNLTIGPGVTVQSGAGAGGATTLQAAGGVITNTGLFTLNGKINASAGALTLTSGLNGTARSDLTLDSSSFGMLGGIIGAAVISGFNDITLNSNMTSNAGLYITAQRNLNIGPAATLVAATETQLRAAAGNISNAGTLNLLGKLTAGTGNLILLSGLDGTNRSNLLLSNATYSQGASVGLVDISGFNDIEFSTDLTSSNVSGVSVAAQRNLTIDAGATVKSSTNLNLRAAGGTITNNGLLTLNGKISAGTGGLTLLSGLNGGNRNDIVLDTNTYAQVASINGISLTGFRDVDVNTNITSHSNVSIIAERNLTVAPSVVIRSGASQATTLQAAGGNKDATGILTLNGSLNLGGNVTLSGGKDLFGNWGDFTWDSAHIAMQGASVGGINLSGFRDITLDAPMTSSNFISMVAERNLTVNPGVTVKNGLANAFTMYAAGGDINHTGILTLNGALNVGANLSSSGMSLLSGLDAFGERADLTLDSSNLQFQDTFITNASLTGFRDLTLERNINLTGTMLARASRDMTITASGGLSSSGDTTIAAGRNFINQAGSGAITSSAGRWLVYSTDPATDTVGDLPYSFRKFNCTYGASCGSLGAGNGLLYSVIDPNSPAAIIGRTDIPDSVIKLSQNPLLNYTPIMSDYLDSSTKVILIFDEELAEQLDLENWYF